MASGHYLLRHSSDGHLTSKFPLAPGRLLVGRSMSAGLYLPDRSVSRRHAEIHVEPGQITVRDLNSRNGTFLDEQQITQSVVQPKQRIAFGSVEFILVTDQLLDSHDFSTEETADARRFQKECEASLLLQGLTTAQRRVFEFLIAGMLEKQIARELDLSRHTVHNHVRAIYRAFGVHTRPELLVRVLQRDS